MSDLHAPGGMEHSLTKKLGPLPLWGWGLVAGAIAVAFMYWRNSQSAADSAASADSVVPPDLADSGASDTPSADAGTEQEFSALENDFATLSTGLSSAQQTNTTQTHQIKSLQTSTHKLQTHEDNEHKKTHGHPVKHHPAKHPTPHGGHAAKPHHETKKRRPKVHGG